jgi:hypothetical protein
MYDHQLREFVGLLESRGLNAEVVSRCGPKKGIQICLRVDHHLYPLWELSDPGNAAALSALDFDSIRLNRVPGWSLDIPDEQQRVARADYHSLYRDALNQIRTEDRIGELYLTHDGIRAVHVNDFPLTDKLVFTAAWGEETAQEIMRKVGA